MYSFPVAVTFGHNIQPIIWCHVWSFLSSRLKFPYAIFQHLGFGYIISSLSDFIIAIIYQRCCFDIVAVITVEDFSVNVVLKEMLQTVFKRVGFSWNIFILTYHITKFRSHFVFPILLSYTHIFLSETMPFYIRDEETASKQSLNVNIEN